MSKLVVRKKEGTFIFSADDILYMEKDKRKIRLHIKYPDEKNEMAENILEFYGNFPQIMEDLDNRFMYCHRSYVINMDAIVWMKECEIFILPNIRIHMGRDAYGRARKIFTGYINEKYPEKTLKNANYFL